MRTFLFRPRNIGERAVTSASAVQYECQTYVRQLAMPLIRERRVKGALSIVSRDSGVSYSKLRKIYYGLTDHILAFEFRSIAEAYKRYLDSQETRLTEELETLKALKARGRQYDLLNQATHFAAVDALDHETRNKPAE